MDVTVNVKLGKKEAEIKLTEVDEVNSDGEITLTIEEASDLFMKLQDAISVTKSFVGGSR